MIPTKPPAPAKRQQDMEAGIACQLIARLAPYAPDIAAAGEAVAELDCILGLAEAARHLNLCLPQVRRWRGRRRRRREVGSSGQRGPGPLGRLVPLVRLEGLAWPVQGEAAE